MKVARLIVALALCWLLLVPESRADPFKNRAGEKFEYQNVIEPSDEAQTLVRYGENVSGYGESVSGREVWTKFDPEGQFAIPYPLLPELGPIGWAIGGAAALWTGMELYEHYHQAPPPSSAPITTTPAPPTATPPTTPIAPLPPSTAHPPSGPVQKDPEGFNQAPQPPPTSLPGGGGAAAQPPPSTGTPPQEASPSGSAIQPDIMNGVIQGGPAQSPQITPGDLKGKTPEEIRQLGGDLGLVPHPTRPDKWLDPVTGKERLRLDPGHTDKQTGKPYDDPKANVPHSHGYEPDGKTKIVDPDDGNPHFPTS